MTALQLARWVLLAGVALVAGCGDNQDDAGARELLKRVRADDYRAWQRAPGYETRRSSNAPHGGAVEIFVNDVVAELLTLEEPVASWPVGSVIAKDGYSGAQLELTALMEKRSDGWYWAEYDAEGTAMFSGHPPTCLDCHGTRASQDYTQILDLPAQ